MTESSLLTNCPYCQTHFQVTAEQLGIADGKVRCGHCMKVFNAPDNQPVTEQPDAIEDGFFADDDLLFQDNPEEDANAGDYAGSSFSFTSDEDAPEADDVDESWAEAMLQENNQPAPPYHHLGREPVSLTNTHKRSCLRTLLWLLAVAVLLGTLVAQVLHFQFDRLSAIPELRPFYERGCELLGCELKPFIDVNKIHSRKLLVRTDPDNRSSLIVDAVMINRAEFAQPFPAITLTFSNLNGDVVAQNLFAPGDYLLGDGKALQSMPPQTPVRIAISIRDPGKDAVNYNIAFKALPKKS